MIHFNDKPIQIKTAQDFYTEFSESHLYAFDTEKIRFPEIIDKDVYNITAPFEFLGKQIIAGRVEERDSEYSSIHFFEFENNICRLIKDAPVFELQDPFFCFIHGEFIFGGVQVTPSIEDSNKLQWATCFFKGTSLYDLTLFFTGPIGMKDIRLCEINDSRIAVLTRPQGVIGGRGKIGYTEISSLGELNERGIQNAKLLSYQTDETSWVGGNTITLLDNGNLGVLGHIANFDEHGNRHYYPMTFEIDPNNETYSELKIIAERNQLEPGSSKRNDLQDVLFPGGIVINNNLARLYLGVSDCEAHWIDISNPFI